MTETQQEIQECITAYLRKYPTLRYTQAMGNIFGNVDHYYMSDEACLNQIKDHLKTLEKEENRDLSINPAKYHRMDDCK